MPRLSNGQVYLLVYRVKKGPGGGISAVKWNFPTGGLVMAAQKLLDGMPVCDWPVARTMANIRWHPAPDEELIICEVFEDFERAVALRLHNAYEADIRDFVELMEQ